MNAPTLFAFALVSGLSILSPGPAVLLAMRNGATYGIRAAAWSSFGNISGLFCLSAASMLGLGLLLQSSTLLFETAKLLGAAYLFYIGIKQLFGRTAAFPKAAANAGGKPPKKPHELYRQAFLLAVTNPKPLFFFTAIFPQFTNAHAPVIPQFFVLTGIFMGLSFLSLLAYAALAMRAGNLARKLDVVRWTNRAIGTAFIAFGACLLTSRRTTT